MVQVPRNPTPQSDDTKNSTYEIPSIYSNEYEPIGESDVNSNSNYYVDVDAKDASFDKKKPPALPPKPANLMKLQQISKQRMLGQMKPPILKQKKFSDYESNESEPDYCSISEIQEEVKTIKIVTSAEIHKDADNEYSEIQEEIDVSANMKKSVTPTELEESFADIPRLPNVTEIIPPSPRKESPMNKLIGTDNYITKSPYKKGGIAKKIILEAKEETSDILAEINNIKSPSILKSPSQNKNKPVFPVLNSPTSLEASRPVLHPVRVDEKPLPLEAEFDWYNLDAEYGRPNNISQTEIVKEIDNLDDMYQYDENLSTIDDEDDPDNPKIEYNLDFEYNPNSETPTPSNDIVEIENNDSFTTVIKINNDQNPQESDENQLQNDENDSSSSNEQSPVKNNCNSTPQQQPIINHFIELTETPKLDQHFHHRKKLNYEKFLSESGLSSKPIILPRKTNHRMFYAGPFV